MVAHWGMSELLGPVSFSSGEDQPFLGKEIHEARDFSDHTARVIDKEITKLLHLADQRAGDVLVEHSDKLDAIAGALLEKEMLDEKDITAVLGPSAQQIASANGKAGKVSKKSYALKDKV